MREKRKSDYFHDGDGTQGLLHAREVLYHRPVVISPAQWWLFFDLFETGSHYVAVLELTLYTRLALNSEILLPLSLLDTGIKGMSHHTQPGLRVF